MPRIYVTETGQVLAGPKFKQAEPTGPRPPLAGLLKYVVNWVGSIGTNAYQAANIFHLLASNPNDVTKTNLNNLVVALNTAFKNNFASQISTSWSSPLQQLVALDGGGLESSDTVAITGSFAQPPLPPNNSVVISWTTNAYWRGGKFRTYIPGIPSTVSSSTGSGAITSAYQASLVAAARAFRTAVNALPFGAGLVSLGGPSYYHQYQLRPAPIFFMFNDANVTTRLDSQRRRLGREIR